MATLTVGPGKQYATITAAVDATQDGDTVQVLAGTYRNDFATIRHAITMQSVGGLAVMQAAASPPNGKAILTVDADATVDGFGFTGAAVADQNGAGIRYEAGKLIVRNSVFWDNQEGLLGNAVTDGTILIQNSEFSHNGAGDGYSHNLYAGAIASLTIQNSYFHDAVVGHEIKSRAFSTTITGSRIQTNGGSGSYDIDLPNGGVALIEGNTIEKGPNAQNPHAIHFGGEGTPYAGSSLLIDGNTIINDKPGGRLVLNAAGSPVTLSYNRLYGWDAANIAYGVVTTRANTTLAGRPALDMSSIVPGAPAAPVVLTLFDAAYYLANNGDVRAAGVDPLAHYLASGWREGRNPSALFDTRYYLAHNYDVAASGVNPLWHYQQSGWREGRDPSAQFSNSKYLAANPDVAAENIDPLLQYTWAGQAQGRAIYAVTPVPADPLAGNALFNADFYLLHNPDVAAARIDPLAHFETFGWHEGRDPSPYFSLRSYAAANPQQAATGIDPLLAFLTSGQAPAQPAQSPYRVPEVSIFDPAYYLAHNADVAAAHLDPLVHYNFFGWHEGRDPSAGFSTNKYLAAYSDVRAAGMDPLAHYAMFGVNEGRTAFPA